ncbi:hypothetical protein ACFVHB_23335 [Kitasatospora sp. NPDC127111]|uniref:hypothetical protein n=1 Tax=Kitasatospora sp. NPDC127111 TaxID=3345363 RepID=UPI00362C5EF8
MAEGQAQGHAQGQAPERGTRLLVHAQEKPLELVFEPWATEYTVPAGENVIVQFGADDWPVEVLHAPDGITFYSGGLHPDVWSRDGRPLLVLSAEMPVPPWSAMPVEPPAHPAGPGAISGE